MAVGRQADYLIESDPSGSARYMIEALRILRHVPLPDQSATVLWSFASVHHWADLDAALSEAKRVLRPQGRLVAIERHSRPGVGGHGAVAGPTTRPRRSPLSAINMDSSMWRWPATGTDVDERSASQPAHRHPRPEVALAFAGEPHHLTAHGLR